MKVSYSNLNTPLLKSTHTQKRKKRKGITKKKVAKEKEKEKSN